MIRALWVATAVILIVATFGAPSRAANDSTDILIKALANKGIITEEDASEVRAEIARIKQEEEASSKSHGVTSKRPVKVGGYLQERYTHSSQKGFDDTLETRRARLTLGGDATENLDFQVQMDFAGSRKAVTGGANTALFAKPILLDAVVGYRLVRDNRLSIGQFKIPFSAESLASDAYLDLINRSQVVEALVPGRDIGSQGRDLGLQYSGVTNFGRGGASQLEYYAGVFDGSGINVTDENDRKDPALRVVLRPNVEGLSLGASYYSGRLGTAETAHNRAGGELIYGNGPWTLKSEYITGKDAAISKRGWYAALIRRINPKIQGVVRLDDLDPDRSSADDSVSTLTAGLSFFLNKDGYSRWQLNYERKKDDAAKTTTNSVLAQFQAGF